MSYRTIVALCAALVFMGPSFAQVPGSDPSQPPRLLEAPATCPGGCCGAEGDCSCNGPQFWGASKYLFAWIRGAEVPPLVTTSPAGTARVAAGVLGLPTTTILTSGTANQDMRSGLRFDTGYWLDAERTWGVEAGFTIIESQATGFAAASDSSTILARPFLNELTGFQESILIAFPGSSAGRVETRVSSGNFYDLNLDLTENALRCTWGRLAGIVGYRYYRYDEGVRVSQAVLPTDPGIVAGTQILTTDGFAAKNEFHGFDMGCRAEFLFQDFSADLLFKLAYGKVHARNNVRGTQTITVPGAAPVTTAAGAFAVGNNLGTIATNSWSVLPEVGASVAWQLSPNLKLRAGYSLLILTDVVRATDTIDFVLNPNQFPPATAPATVADRPTFRAKQTDIWIQSVSIGAEFSF